jgi:hypothetical protein
MGPLSYMRSVIDRNVVMRRISVIGACVLNALLQRILSAHCYKNYVILSCISASIGGIALKTHTSYSPPMCYKWCKFGCDRSVINDTTLRTKYLFGSISVPIGGIFLKLHTFHAYATKGVSLVEVGQYIWVLHLENQGLFRLYFGFLWRNFPRTSYLTLLAHALEIVQLWLWSVDN